MLRRFICLCGVVSTAFACGNAAPDLPVVASATATKALRRATLTNVNESEAVDGDGRVWTILGPATLGGPAADWPAPPELAEDPDDTPWELRLTVEELANNLRPVRVQDGIEYVLRDPPLELARDIQQARREGRLAP